MTVQVSAEKDMATHTEETCPRCKALKAGTCPRCGGAIRIVPRLVRVVIAGAELPEDHMAIPTCTSCGQTF